MKAYKKIPHFRNEDEEREFWARKDSTEYLDYSQAKKVMFPKLKPSTKKISFRIPEYLLDQLRQSANKRDIPYQSYLKHILAERLEKEKVH